MRLLDHIKLWIERRKVKKELYQLKLTETQYSLNRKQCYLLLTLLDVNKFKKYKPTSGLSIIINTRYNDIGVYIKKIIATSAILKRGEMIPIDWDLAAEQTISLDRFLTSEGYYIPIEKSILEFKNRSMELCVLMESSDTTAYGLPEHNKRMMIRMLNNIRLISAKLIEIK